MLQSKLYFSGRIVDVSKEKYDNEAVFTTIQPTNETLKMILNSVNIEISKPSQPEIKNSKKESNDRSFQISWYSNYKWIHNDLGADLVFCFPCLKFGLNEAINNAFTNIGFNNWKKAIESFIQHQNSNFNKNATIR
ncbi:unnamed protein product [Brachionus calyciflorus]|uniref:TTF-type domain-containing protein n=1 Tax=Brachionus calyciflorus TaxID=104777 RepID=A0A814KLF6_9BILA|nr:unnamed protein product [Brachionus calyciflorus]